MTATTHTPKNVKVFSAFDTFYNDQTPANAIALAISDHRGYNKGSEIGEYTTQLHRARDICNAHDELVAALRGLLDAGDFIQPLHGETTVKRVRQAGKLIEATDAARAALQKVQP